MADLATLGLAIDSQPAVAASSDLDKLAASAAKTDAAVSGMVANTTAAATKVKAASGAVSEYSTATSNAAKMIDAHTKAVNDNVRAHGGNNIAMLEATHIVRSLAEQFAAGVDPMRAFTLEGGRIATLFQYGGGVSGVLSLVGNIVGKLINPFSLAAGAIGGIGAAAALSVTHIQSLNDEMNRAVLGAGRFTGLTGSALGGLASASSAQTGVSLGDSRATAAALASSGKFDPANITGVMGLTRGYAGASGLSNSEAGSKLAEMLADPLKGLDDLNKMLGGVDDRTRQYVKSLMAQGSQQEALRIAIDATSASLNEMAKPQGAWDRFMAGFGRRNAEIEKSIANATSGPTDAERYRSASRFADRGLGEGLGTDTSTIAETMRFRSMLTGGSPLMRSEQADNIAGRRSQEGGDVVRSVLPDITRYQDLVDQQKKLFDAIANPDALGKMGVTAGQAHEALDRLNVGLSTFKSNAQQIVETSAFNVAALQARTFAEKTTIESQRAYTETLERTHSALDAAASAEAKRNEAIAAANKNADDAARQQSQSNALLGLRPAQRLEVERQQAIDNANRVYGGGPLPTVVGAPSMGAGASVPPNQIRAFQLLVAAGYPPAAAAGFVGGLTGESTSALDPTIVNPKSGAFGVAQDLGDRKNQVLSGDTSFDGQIANAIRELRGSGAPGLAGRQLASGSSVEMGLNANHTFEGMSDAEWSASQAQRRAAGQNLYAYVQANGMASKAGGIPMQAAAASTVTSTALGTATGSANDNYRAQFGELAAAPLRGAQDALAQQRAAEAILEQTASLDKFGRSAGTTAGQIAMLNERQSLLNDYARAGVTVTPELGAKIDDLARQYGAAAKAATDFRETQRATIAALDGVRGAARDGLGTFVDDLIKGRSAGTAFRDVLEGLGQQILKMGESSLVDSLFGKSGTAGGGLFGGGLGSIFSSLFGGGSSVMSSIIPHFAIGTPFAPGGPSLVGEKGPEIVNLPRGSQVVPNDKLGGMGGITVGGHTIVIQGNADKDTAAMIDQKINAANAAQLAAIQRNFGTLQANYGKRYG